MLMKIDYFTLKNLLYQRAQMVAYQTNLCIFPLVSPHVKFTVNIRL
jgi:hypothetical protein